MSNAFPAGHPNGQPVLLKEAPGAFLPGLTYGMLPWRNSVCREKNLSDRAELCLGDAANLSCIHFEDRIRLLCTLERAEKLKFFRQIDVFSVPSPYREPKGIPVLEVLASGVPVVQPDHGAYPEWIHATQGGLLYDPNDTADLAEKLACLLRDAKLRTQLGRQGRQAIFENFSSERMASATLDVLRKLAARSTGSESGKLPLDAITAVA